MIKRTYTRYRLTDAQLRTLSQIKNGNLRNRYGPTCKALRLKGLIDRPWKSDGSETWSDFVITERGRSILALARAEGW